MPEVSKPNPADHLSIVGRVVRRTRGLVPWVDQSDIEDVAQLALVEAAGEYAGECDAEAYLHRRVRCAVLDFLRGESCRVGNRGEFPVEVDWQAENLPRGEIYEALKALPPRQYRIVMLHFWGRRSQAEIAGELGVCQSSISRDLQAALRALRVFL